VCATYLCVSWPIVFSKRCAIAALVVTIAVVGDDEEPARLTGSDVGNPTLVFSCGVGLARVWDINPSKLLQPCRLVSHKLTLVVHEHVLLLDLRCGVHVRVVEHPPKAVARTVIPVFVRENIVLVMISTS